MWFEFQEIKFLEIKFKDLIYIHALLFCMHLISQIGDQFLG